MYHPMMSKLSMFADWFQNGAQRLHNGDGLYSVLSNPDFVRTKYVQFKETVSFDLSGGCGHVNADTATCGCAFETPNDSIVCPSSKTASDVESTNKLLPAEVLGPLDESTYLLFYVRAVPSRYCERVVKNPLVRIELGGDQTFKLVALQTTRIRRKTMERRHVIPSKTLVLCVTWTLLY